MGAKQRRRESSNRTLWIILSIVGGVLLVMIGVCAGGVYFFKKAMVQLIGDVDIATPGLELQSQDYAEARSQFRTKLVRNGPAPQEWLPVTRPKGVLEVEFPSGNLRLKAWMSPPAAGNNKQPAVLFLHGGFAFGEDDWDMAQPYRDAGFAVMTPILRGENGQPGNFSMFYDELDDVLTAADYLAKQPQIDPKRIFVAGHSAGGTLTLLAALTSTRFRAAAAFSGSPDQVLFTRSNPEYAVFDQSNMREFQMRSPVAFASSFKCPARLYYGSFELGFHASSQRTAMLAKQKGLDVEAVAIPGDHETAVPAAMAESIRLFQRP